MDIDGDGLDELIVGSPLYTTHSQSRYCKIQICCLFYHLNSLKNRKFKFQNTPCFQFSKSSVGYEEGKMSIYTENNGILQFKLVRYGDIPKARFGSAIAR